MKNKKNLPNIITVTRIIMSLVIILLLCFPYDRFESDFKKFQIEIFGIPVYVLFLICGILFIIASVTDFLDGYIARKYGLVSNTGKMLDAIADKLLVDTVLIILAHERQFNVIVPVIIVMRDIVVNAIKMQAASMGKVVAAIKSGKLKTATQMVGIALIFFNNIPFAYFIPGANVGKYLVYFSTLMALISMYQYYTLNKALIFDKKDTKESK